MSIQQAQALDMTETSVIKHYKKQLIYRQHDVPDSEDKHTPQLLNEVSNTKIYDLVESEKTDTTKNDTNNGRRPRKKRKNKNCRGQFRHEAMELIKLGTSESFLFELENAVKISTMSAECRVFAVTERHNAHKTNLGRAMLSSLQEQLCYTSHSLCKTKEPTTRIEKPLLEKTTKDNDRSIPQSKTDNIKEVSNRSIIQTNYKTILENSSPNQSRYSHALPQMVPERRNSREFQPKIPIVYNSTNQPANQLQPLNRLPLPDYHIPIHSYPLPHSIYPHPTPLFRPTPPLPPPPPYPVTRSPPRPVPRTPIRPIPQTTFQKNLPYPEQCFSFPKNNGFHHHVNPCILPSNYPEVKRRRHDEKMTAIDLTVDPGAHSTTKSGHHKCHCECGKTYTSDPVTQEVIISIGNRDSVQMPKNFIRGKMVNGVLQVNQNNLQSVVNSSSNGTTKSTALHSKGQTAPEGKLFLIDDLLNKKHKYSKPESYKECVPIPKESSRVIVSTKSLEKPILRPKLKDYCVSAITGNNNNRRQSVDIDTISISSSSSESLRSPRPKSSEVEKHIPQGKLFYYKSNNSFIRYFDDTQKKLFIDSITSEDQNSEKNSLEEKEVIELPRNTTFSGKDNLTVEEYVSEMSLVEKFIPRDFFLFYKFVTGYQIYNNNLPVSFLTFLKVYNTNGLKVLLEKYINSLKQN